MTDETHADSVRDQRRAEYAVMRQEIKDDCAEQCMILNAEYDLDLQPVHDEHALRVSILLAGEAMVSSITHQEALTFFLGFQCGAMAVKS